MDQSSSIVILSRTVQETAFQPMSKNYPILGLVSEVGELASELKKIERNDGGLLTEQRYNNLVEEFGDILWYLEAFAIKYGILWHDAIMKNREKLLARKVAGTINER